MGYIGMVCIWAVDQVNLYQDEVRVSVKGHYRLDPWMNNSCMRLVHVSAPHPCSKSINHLQIRARQSHVGTSEERTAHKIIGTPHKSIVSRKKVPRKIKTTEDKGPV